ncbi:hypothetical protein [Bdellovibrio sp. HCB2-146]|uniref:hypothetical protein n=1 Tax=Bdellovibrio sp. HCB2-146 TaxID=3394362 RepID=UPI0039BD8496
MKKIFLAFSIVIGFSFAWAQQSVNPGTEPNEALVPQGGNVAEMGFKKCTACEKNKFNGRLLDNTNPSKEATGADENTSPANTSGATQ